MKFSTIIIGQDKSQVRLLSCQKYDPFNIFPRLEFLKYNNLFVVDEGKLFLDYLGDQGPLRFMSERFKNLLESNGITGLSYMPIQIKDSNLMYYAFIEKIVESQCEYDEDGDRVYGSFKVDMSSWQGEDIFYLKDSGATVCTWRTPELIEKNRITNVDFEDLDKY